MYLLNKIVGGLTNPFTVMWIGMAAGCLCLAVGRKKAVGLWLVGLSVAWLWLWATPLVCRAVGVPLERPYLADGRVPSVESHANVAAIVLHGGAMGDDAALGGRGEMWASADRVWMAARLWRALAGRAKAEGGGAPPPILVTGGGVKVTTAGLLEDFGVPTNAVVFAEEPRNTEEEAKFVNGRVNGRLPSGSPAAKPKVLVVTSAWHMKRTLLMYAKYAPGLEAMPAPCDFENTVRASQGFSWCELLPSDEALVANHVSLHEWVGIFGYRWLRR